MTIKNHTCPFCLQKFGSRGFLLNVHIPDCSVREKYFQKVLEPDEMEIIKARINGENDYKKYIETKTFVGYAFPKEECKKFEVFDP